MNDITVKNAINRIARIIFVYILTTNLFNIDKDQHRSPSLSSSILYKNALQLGDKYNFFMFLNSSSESNFSLFNSSDSLLWSMKNLKYGDWESGNNSDGSFTKSFTLLNPSKLFINNQSLYIHVFIIKENQNIPCKKCILSYGHFKMNKQQCSLNSDKFINGAEEKMCHTPLNLIHPNLSVNFLTDNKILTQKEMMPSHCNTQIRFNNTETLYYPPVIFNNYWNLNNEYILIENNTAKFDLTVTFSLLSLFKLQYYVSELNINIPSIFYKNEKEEDFVKRIIYFDANIYIFGAFLVGCSLLLISVALTEKNDFQNRQTPSIIQMITLIKVFLCFLYFCNNYILTLFKRIILAQFLLRIFLFIEHMMINYKISISTSFIKKDGQYRESMFSRFDQNIFFSILYYILDVIENPEFYEYFLFPEWFNYVLSVAFLSADLLIINYLKDYDKKINDASLSTLHLTTITLLRRVISILFIFIFHLPPLFYLYNIFHIVIIFYPFILSFLLRYPVHGSGKKHQ